MFIELILIGKTKKRYTEEAFLDLYKRFKKYGTVQTVFLKSSEGSLEKELIQKKEAQELLKHLTKSDYVILLDEKGKEMDSIGFAKYLNHTLETYPSQKICFVVGGAYGFSEEIYQRAQQKISFSNMTFSHQLIRLMLAEQLYRAFTIIHGEAYHHE